MGKACNDDSVATRVNAQSIKYSFHDAILIMNLSYPTLYTGSLMTASCN